MNAIAELVIAVATLCSNTSDRDLCTKRIIQCTEDKNYIGLVNESKQEHLLKYCVNKELKIKEQKDDANTP